MMRSVSKAKYKKLSIEVDNPEHRPKLLEVPTIRKKFSKIDFNLLFKNKEIDSGLSSKIKQEVSDVDKRFGELMIEVGKGEKNETSVKLVKRLLANMEFNFLKLNADFREIRKIPGFKTDPEFKKVDEFINNIHDLIAEIAYDNVKRGRGVLRDQKRIVESQEKINKLFEESLLPASNIKRKNGVLRLSEMKIQKKR